MVTAFLVPLLTARISARAIDSAKGMAYKDPFRRVRELQGDEGFKGIHQQGTKYQLVSLNVSQKKQPRTYLPDKKWAKVVSHYDGVCAVCGSPPGDEGFQQDHKIPRDRGGTDDLENWQPLCDACNNLKAALAEVAPKNVLSAVGLSRNIINPSRFQVP